MKLRKLLSIVLLLVVALTVAACTKTTTAPATTTAETTGQVNLDVTYPTGEYNYRFASADLRHTFFAAAEKYLLNNMYAGVPVFANAGFVLYSPRVQLPVSKFVAVMGWGAPYATMSLDDSTVIMDDGKLGTPGNYTYRNALAQNPTTFQQWIYQDATSSDVMTWFLDAPYTYKYNDAKDGYQLVPSMAADYPKPISPTTLDTGITVAKVWQIDLKDNLKWTYHPDTNTAGLPAGHEIIDANDFVDTYKLALEKGWFRAVSGGGDFLSQSQEVVGAKNFYDKKGTWEEVGIKKIDNNTIQFEFVGDMSEWNVRYWLGSFVVGPINLELYNVIGDSYGTTPATTVYNGAYVMDYYEPDSIIRYSKNPNFHDQDDYFFTHYSYRIIADAEIRFQEFIAGKLDVAALPTPKFENFKNHPGLKRVPGPTTFRIMINGLETVEKQQAQFEGSDYVPEPILANQNFKKAMYFAIDRKKLAEEVLKTSQTQMYLFSDAYLVDAQSGIPFRNTEHSDKVAEGLSPSTNGFNADLAVSYWKDAINALVQNGTYTPGTASNPTYIDIDLKIFTGSEAQLLFGEYIKSQFESLFVSNDHNIKVRIAVTPTAFPGIYYDYMMTGKFDLSIGGISGSTLDASSFLDTYCSDNRGGFTLNWGIDTSVAEIEVKYVNPKTGELVREMWSFDAITAVLNGDVEVKDGVEVKPAAPAPQAE